MPKFSDMLFNLCGFPLEGTVQKASIPVKERIVSIAKKIFSKSDKYPMQRVENLHTKIMQEKNDLGKRVRRVSTLYTRLTHYKKGGNLKV